MSLINTMLNDLDARQVSPRGSDGEPLSGLRVAAGVPSTPGSGLRSRLLLIGLLAIGAYALAGQSRTDGPAGAAPEALRSPAEAPVEGVGGDESDAAPTPAARRATPDDLRPGGDSARGEVLPGAPEFLARQRGRAIADRTIGRDRLKLALSLSAFDEDRPAPSAEQRVPRKTGVSAALSGVEVSGEGDESVLILRLSTQPRYVLYTLEDPPRAVIELEDTVLEGKLEIPRRSPLLTAVRARRRADGDLLVIFDLAQRARIEASDLLATGGRYELVLHLTRGSGGDRPVLAEATRPARDADAKAHADGSSRSIKTKAVAAPVAELVEQLYEEGVRSIAGGKDAEGERRLREALASAPEHAPSRAYLARLLMARNRTEEASRLLRAGLAIDPHRAELAILLARASLQRGNRETALGVLRTARSDGANDPELDAFLAALLQRAGRHEEAVALYQSVVTRQPDNGVWWMGLGISLEAGRRDAEALAAFEHASRAPSLSPDLRRYVEERLVALGRRES